MTEGRPSDAMESVPVVAYRRGARPELGGQTENELIEIRDEQPGDIAAVRDVNRQAFGQDQEGRIVDALRAHGVELTEKSRSGIQPCEPERFDA